MTGSFSSPRTIQHVALLTFIVASTWFNYMIDPHLAGFLLAAATVSVFMALALRRARASSNWRRYALVATTTVAVVVLLVPHLPQSAWEATAFGSMLGGVSMLVHTAWRSELANTVWRNDLGVRVDWHRAIDGAVMFVFPLVCASLMRLPIL